MELIGKRYIDPADSGNLVMEIIGETATGGMAVSPNGSDRTWERNPKVLEGILRNMPPEAIAIRVCSKCGTIYRIPNPKVYPDLGYSAPCTCDAISIRCDSEGIAKLISRIALELKPGQPVYGRINFADAVFQGVTPSNGIVFQSEHGGAKILISVENFFRRYLWGKITTTRLLRKPAGRHNGYVLRQISELHPALNAEALRGYQRLDHIPGKISAYCNREMIRAAWKSQFAPDPADNHYVIVAVDGSQFMLEY